MNFYRLWPVETLRGIRMTSQHCIFSAKPREIRREYALRDIKSAGIPVSASSRLTRKAVAAWPLLKDLKTLNGLRRGAHRQSELLKHACSGRRSKAPLGRVPMPQVYRLPPNGA